MSEYANTRHTLIQRLKNRYDEAAWEEFVEIYRLYIFVVIRRMDVPANDANELAQNLLVKLWQKLPDFKYQPEVARFRTWLSRVIYNAVVSHYRSEKKKRETFELDDQGSMDAEINQMMTEEWENYIANVAFDRVKPLFSGKAIQVFELSLEGKTIEEVAAALDLTNASVYKLKSRVKEKLQKEISFLREDLG